MADNENDGIEKISQLFEGCRLLHRKSYPGSSLDFDQLNLTGKLRHGTRAHAKGHFADVYKGIMNERTVVAVKMLRLPNFNSSNESIYQNTLLRFFRELDIWAKLDHVNIARLLGFTIVEGNISLISLWHPNGNLVQYLQARPDANKDDLMLDVAEGTHYLHTCSSPLVHGDLKGANILVSEVGIACLADFGISKQIDDINRKTGFTTTSGVTGTIPWMAPELDLGFPLAFPCDVYSCGGVFLEICCPGKPPYYYVTQPRDMILAKDRGEVPEWSQYPEMHGEDTLWQLMCRCWEHNPVARPSMGKVVDALYRHFRLNRRSTYRETEPSSTVGAALKFNPVSTASPRSFIVYPALLSRVAEALEARSTLLERTKDGLTYQDVFDGREGVTKIAFITKTTDRSIALLLGRALDAQNFFHDVTYRHRLRDTPEEMYQFSSRVPTRLVRGEEGMTPSTVQREDSIVESAQELPGAKMLILPEPLPSGVFTPLTECYSSTCSMDSLCYSAVCPRRLEQQARLNMKPHPVLDQGISYESFGDHTDHEDGNLWVRTVPQEVVDSLSEREKMRQEAINEIMCTERDFVRDMEYLRDIWIQPLQTCNIIPEERRSDFIKQLFWNIHEIIATSARLRDALWNCRQSCAVVETIGDVFLEVVYHFQPFVAYGAHQLYGEWEFKKEKASNPVFARFVKEMERLPKSRKLALNGYLTKPTTRLAQYPLLLEAVWRLTPEENTDKYKLARVIKIVREFLEKVNEETSRSENRFALLRLDQQLVFRSGDVVDLRLRDEKRKLLFKGLLEGSENVPVFLFDHMLLMVKPRMSNERYHVYRRPIPLEFLVVSPEDDSAEQMPTTPPLRGSRPASPYEKQHNERLTGVVSAPTPQSYRFALTFVALGRRRYTVKLHAPTRTARDKWLEVITKQQEVLRRRDMTFETITLSQGFFQGPNKVNCAAPFDRGRRLALGTESGVYFADLRDQSQVPLQVLAIPGVTQVDVLDNHDLLIVLSEHSVITFPLDSLDSQNPTASLKRAKQVSSQASFFKAGTCLGRTLLCVVNATSLASEVTVLEPTDQIPLGENKSTFGRLLQGVGTTFRVLQEFHLPTEASSIHLAKTQLCVGCPKGFEIVHLETLDTESLLDPVGASLDFVQEREDVRPIAIYRVEDEYLLCYNDFAFYVNKSGSRSRPSWIIHWEGRPTSFALRYPFVLAFEPDFVEVWHINTGTLIQVIPGKTLNCLYADTPLWQTSSAANLYNQYPHFRNLHRSPHSLNQPPYGIPPPPLPYGQYPLTHIGHQLSYSYGQLGQALPPPSHQQRTMPYMRDEIIFVSGDQVLAVQECC